MRILAIVFLLVTGCGLPSVVARKPAPSVEDDAVVAVWVEDIRRNAKHGDWLLTRNYALSGDVIAGLSPGESLSHAAVYDKERDMVIEATSPRVQAVTLERFVRRYRRVMVVRPTFVDRADQVEAVDRAWALVGRDYDYRGLVGFDDEERFYCSEFPLVVADSRGEVERPLVVPPSVLLGVSDVVYDGGIRDAPETKALALRRWRHRHRTHRAGVAVAER